MRKALIAVMLLGALWLVAACGADAPPEYDGGVDLEEFWDR